MTHHFEHAYQRFCAWNSGSGPYSKRVCAVVIAGSSLILWGGLYVLITQIID